MNAQTRPAAQETATRSISEVRETERTAGLRCQCYAAFSELTASPHDVDARVFNRDRAGIGGGVPYALTLDELIEEFAVADIAWLKSEYSGLFEIGSQGPPAPIREDLLTGQKAGTREDIVRFYDFFGYRLDDRYAWAPDHLSVELEFMHFLCFHEASAAGDVLSYQLAQTDFSARHLHNWIPRLAESVTRLAPDSFYCRVLIALRDFVARDCDWQASTIVATGGT